ncbi:aggregation-promoting factor C-terminal-like domain-containing protein [Actinomadura keratinilytica]|uniref:aggregation-promoting factor C-terminal-like domain-containing protein n=1 Tax=Actinomadura keratinilytica TaxID=547461 RepID=UPI003620810C
MEPLLAVPGDPLDAREQLERTRREPVQRRVRHPQALPASKLASAGADWRTSSPTQIAWGLGYIKARYKDPCRAWAFWQRNHWY